ncbi:MAG: hypothetical protein ABJD07_03060 [Gemmatimonadaceae bacterium]
MLTLFRHDGAYSIRVDGVELMSTRRHHSEEKLAELVCAPLAAVRDATVLIGGLGFGFTLAAALRSLASDARIVVAELVPGVIDWNRNPDYDLAGVSLLDARVELRQADVASVLREQRGAYDAIMLDVDNGADALTNGDNVQLYRRDGIRAASEALRAGGRIAYWSATEDPAFADALRGAGLAVQVKKVRAHATSGSTKHWLFIAQPASGR